MSVIENNLNNLTVRVDNAERVFSTLRAYGASVSQFSEIPTNTMKINDSSTIRFENGSSITFVQNALDKECQEMYEKIWE